MTALNAPLTLRGTTLKNRIVVSPMCQHAAIDGHVQDWHMVHYGKFVLGGAALFFTESTAVASDSRIGFADLGLWSDDHVPGIRRLADFAHQNGALMGVQLAHAGRKSFCAPLWEGGHALSMGEVRAVVPEGRRVGPSAISAGEEWSVPDVLSEADIEEIIGQFADAAGRAVAAGVDVIELHYGHGYLVPSFLSRVVNQRDDAYGGSLENRMRLALQIAGAVRGRMPDTMPLFARLSCLDGNPESWSMEETVILARAIGECGVDVIDCSSGGLTEEVRNSNVPRGLGYQVPFAEQIRAEAGIATQAVGVIVTPEQANEIVATGKADLVAIGRAALRNPYWPAEALRKLTGATDFGEWPMRHRVWLQKREPLMEKLRESGELGDGFVR